MDLSFWAGKRVFLTGHTGFKGSWLSHILLGAGARLSGYALAPAAGEESLFCLANLQTRMESTFGDIRDAAALEASFQTAQPDIVIHMAAQPLVRDSYQNPAYTYETNVMGTVNILECVRKSKGVKSFLNVTTDKVYLNREWQRGYTEDDPLDGYDPYSNSKSCSELVTHSYTHSFFSSNEAPAISTARAGNVIGGGDFAKDRILPDCVRAAQESKPITVRNKDSVRPYQHVLEPLFAYLLICQKQYEDANFAGWYNVGPDDADCVTTETIVEAFCRYWGNGQSWQRRPDGGPHEATLLKLDCTKIKEKLGWAPRWDVDIAVQKVVEWSRGWLAGRDVLQLMDEQIEEFLHGDNDLR